jgi:hypothetical protein
MREAAAMIHVDDGLFDADDCSFLEQRERCGGVTNICSFIEAKQCQIESIDAYLPPHDVSAVYQLLNAARDGFENVPLVAGLLRQIDSVSAQGLRFAAEQYESPFATDDDDRAVATLLTIASMLDKSGVKVVSPPPPPPSQELPPKGVISMFDPNARATNIPPPSEPIKPEFIRSGVIDMAASPTPEELAQPHQRVTLKNFSPHQTHMIADRHLKYIEFKPGQQREIDMPVTGLQNLMRLARTDRGFYESGPNIGKPFPPHPLRVVGMQPKQVDARRV